MSTTSSRAGQSQRALMGVRELIISGELAAGARLHEVALSARLGISRTPLRAALARLGQEGLVEALPTGGYAVRSFSREDVIDAIELRGVLEGTAVRLAAERGVSSDRMTVPCPPWVTTALALVRMSSCTALATIVTFADDFRRRSSSALPRVTTTSTGSPAKPDITRWSTSACP